MLATQAATRASGNAHSVDPEQTWSGSSPTYRACSPTAACSRPRRMGRARADRGPGGLAAAHRVPGGESHLDRGLLSQGCDRAELHGRSSGRGLVRRDVAHGDGARAPPPRAPVPSASGRGHRCRRYRAVHPFDDPAQRLRAGLGVSARRQWLSPGRARVECGTGLAGQLHDVAGRAGGRGVAASRVAPRAGAGPADRRGAGSGIARDRADFGRAVRVVHLDLWPSGRPGRSSTRGPPDGSREGRAA